jgi:hypothetical protein
MDHHNCTSFNLKFQANSSSIFTHGGFTNSVSDFDFSKIEDSWRVIAASEDNQIQAFSPARRLVAPWEVEGTDDVAMEDVSSDEETG